MEFVANILFNEFANVFFTKTKHPYIMRLNLFVDGDAALKAKYVDYARNHNKKLMEECHFYDSGFDLFLPDAGRQFTSNGVNKVDFQVRCSAQIVSSYNINYEYYTGYYVYPRSSLSKTALRLANSTGIIDAGYRGHLIGMFDCNRDGFQTEQYDRLVQVCAPNLMPIFVNVVETMEDLGPNTSRGNGGFGSSGR